MKTNASETIRTFATLRVMGDDLIPDEITRVLETKPTLAYRKGENYSRVKRSITGRSGMWLFSTDSVVESLQLEHHVEFLASIIKPGSGFARIDQLSNLMERKQLTADVVLFWHGRAKSRSPRIGPVIERFFNVIPAKVLRDFARDEAEPASHRAA
jgi:hypothetical protein